MKRLLLAAAFAAGSFAAVAPAHATIITCNNLPVMVECYDFTSHQWCAVWVKPYCLNVPPLTVAAAQH
ncbi:MAG TPA: hypothetical protein VFQ85_08715 [Mycobacteriales bacterium]|jgi:hypothetical protein|nr:hypothetical protein [Mycobacteriales bacterium]